MAEPSSETITQKPRIPMLKHAPQTTEETRRSLKWRVVDIAVGAAVGVMSGVMFWVFDGMSYGLFPLLTLILPGSAALLHALFYFPATLGLLIVRKPGASAYVLLVASFVEVVLGTKYSVSLVVIALSGSDRARAGARRRNGVRGVPLPPLDAWRHIAVIRGDRHRIQLLPVVLLLPGVFVLQPARTHRHRMRTAKRGRIRRLRIMGTIPCLGQVRSPRTFLIRTVITTAPARPDVRAGDYNVIRRFLSTGSIRRTSSSRSRFRSA